MLNVNNLTLVFIIWEKIGTEYKFVNTYNTKEIFSISASASALLSKDAYTLSSNLVEENTQLVIGNNGIVGEANVQLIDMQGRIVKTILNEDIHSEKTVQIESGGLAAGTYLISIQIGNKIATEKVVFLR